MRRLMQFAAFLPLIEVVLIVIVWRAIGGWWTLALLVAGSLIGVGLLRVSPVRTVAGVRAELVRGGHPGPAVMGGLALALAGALFLFPGFFPTCLPSFCSSGRPAAHSGRGPRPRISIPHHPKPPSKANTGRNGTNRLRGLDNGWRLFMIGTHRGRVLATPAWP